MVAGDPALVPGRMPAGSIGRQAHPQPGRAQRLQHGPVRIGGNGSHDASMFPPFLE
jgi:hypothetical protein